MGDVLALTDKIKEGAQRAAAIASVLEALSSSGETPTLHNLSTAYVLAVIAVCGGNKSRAARVLGIERRAVYRWLERNREAA